MLYVECCGALAVVSVRLSGSSRRLFDPYWTGSPSRALGDPRRVVGTLRVPSERHTECAYYLLKV